MRNNRLNLKPQEILVYSLAHLNFQPSCCERTAFRQTNLNFKKKPLFCHQKGSHYDKHFWI